MSALEIRIPHAPKTRFGFGGFARVAATLAAVLDAFTEAQRQAHEAKRRYPFTTW